MSKRVLLIENTLTHPVIAELLTGDGCEVDAVRDSESGFNLLDNRTYDLIIVRESHGAESWKLCQQIRRVSALPLIVISANASTDCCVRAINAGADYFMRKPFGPLEFLARVNSLLQRNASRQPQTVSP